MKIPESIVYFFRKQGFVIVNSLDEEGSIHTAAKGIVGIEENGQVFLLDLYLGDTFKNIKRNPTISITAVDEHAFEGYTLKGKANLVSEKDLKKHIIAAWKDGIAKRLTNRIIKTVSSGKRATSHHPEAKMPAPKYLIEVDVENIVDLTPQALKKEVRSQKKKRSKIEEKIK